MAISVQHYGYCKIKRSVPVPPLRLSLPGAPGGNWRGPGSEEDG